MDLNIITSIIVIIFLLIIVKYYFNVDNKIVSYYNKGSKNLIFKGIEVDINYNVATPFQNSFLQTITRAIVNVEKIDFVTETLISYDEEEILINWFPNENLPDTAPIILVFPGITGCCCTNYLKCLVKSLAKENYRLVHYNYRGLCKSRIKCAKFNSPCDTRDMEVMIDHVSQRYPKAMLAAIGFSMGGIMLCNYLDKVGKNTPLRAAMVVSMLWDPIESQKSMERPMALKLFNETITRYLVNAVKNNYEAIARKFDGDRILKAKTVSEFDTSFSIKAYGYENLTDYYNSFKIKSKIHNILIPVLCLTSKDDPFVPLSSIPIDEIEKSEYLTLILTEFGGHVSFIKEWRNIEYGLIETIASRFAKLSFSSKI